MIRTWFAVLSACAVASSAQAEEVEYYTEKSAPSQIRFLVPAPLDDIVGVSDSVSGMIRFDAERGSGTAQLDVNLSTFTTGISLRDQDLQERFFEIDRHPRATLRVHRLVDGEALGTLSLHGKSQAVRIPIRYEPGIWNHRAFLRVSGRFTVKFSDYGIPRPEVLFLKLGNEAEVEVEGVFFQRPEKEQQLAGSDVPRAKLFRRGAFIPVARAEKIARGPRFAFAEHTDRGRGERLMYDASVGGPGNAVACIHCHGLEDERSGHAIRGVVPPNHTLFDAAKRPRLWQGLAKSGGDAASLCARLFMLDDQGLTEEQERWVDAYLAAISPDDSVPELDYRVLALTRRSDLASSTGGNRQRGAALTERFCGGCHGNAKMRPPLTPGLYESDYLVRRIRWLPGHDARQMPPIHVDRLTDRDLREIVTHLAGDESQRIFDRRHAMASKEKRD